MRKKPLRREAPSTGWHTMPAEVPAQDGLSSSREKAMNRASDTASESRNP